MSTAFRLRIPLRDKVTPVHGIRAHTHSVRSAVLGRRYTLTTVWRRVSLDDPAPRACRSRLDGLCDLDADPVRQPGASSGHAHGSIAIVRGDDEVAGQDVRVGDTAVGGDRRHLANSVPEVDDRTTQRSEPGTPKRRPGLFTIEGVVEI